MIMPTVSRANAAVVTRVRADAGGSLLLPAAETNNARPLALEQRGQLFLEPATLQNQACQRSTGIDQIVFWTLAVDHQFIIRIGH